MNQSNIGEEELETDNIRHFSKIIKKKSIDEHINKSELLLKTKFNLKIKGISKEESDKTLK